MVKPNLKVHVQNYSQDLQSLDTDDTVRKEKRDAGCGRE